MNQKDLDDLKDFVYLLVKKSVDYLIKPEKKNLKLLRYLTNNFYMCLPKRAKDEFRDNIKEIRENIKEGLNILKEYEQKQDEKKPLNYYLIEKEIKNLKRGL
jgi:hypothetical protein